MTAETIHTCSYECERPECIRAQRDELAARLTAAQQKQPAEGEDIMVNTPYDVFILPLRPSGLDGKGPRFVVHVPGPEQPAPQAQSSTEAWRDLAIAGAAIVEEIREIVGLKGKPGDVVKAVRELAAALEAAREDAERWRALREMDGGEIYALLGDCDGIHPEHADAAIDAAMEKEVSND